MKIQNIGRNEHPYMQVIACIIDQCNYSCSYCYNERPRSQTLLDLDILREYIQFIYAKKHQHIEVNLLGGEPTLHPKLFDFCRSLQDNDSIDILIYSNMSQSETFYRSMLNLKNVRFDFSYHTLARKRNQHYIQSILALTKDHLYEKKKINITLMLENRECFEDIKKIDTIFKTIGVYNYYNVDYRLIRDFQNIDDFSYYTEDELRYFKNVYVRDAKVKTFQIDFDDNMSNQYSIEEFDMSTFCKFNGWNCNAGVESVYCHFSGDVFICQSECIEGRKPFFNINSRQFIVPESRCVCRCNNCRIDCEITKWQQKA